MRHVPAFGIIPARESKFRAPHSSRTPPRNAPTRRGRTFQSSSLHGRCLGLRYASAASVAAKRRRLGFRAAAAFGDSSSEHDQSPSRKRHRRLSRGRFSRRLRFSAPRRPRPLHSAPTRRPFRSLRIDTVSADCARASMNEAQSPQGFSARSRCAARTLWSAKPVPCGLRHDSARGPAGGPAARAPRSVRASRSCRPSPASTLTLGADCRHPSGAADLTVRLGWGPRSAARCTRARVGRKRKQKVMTMIETAPSSRVFRALSLDDPRNRIARPRGGR